MNSFEVIVIRDERSGHVLMLDSQPLPKNYAVVWSGIDRVLTVEEYPKKPAPVLRRQVRQ